MISGNEIDELLQTNLAGALDMLKGIARIMKRRIHHQHLLNRGGIGSNIFGRKELAPSGIRVNAITPGLIDTKMTQAFPAERKHILERQIGMGRLGTPEDVADVALFLASDLSRYVTGQVVGVDGGLVT